MDKKKIRQFIKEQINIKKTLGVKGKDYRIFEPASGLKEYIIQYEPGIDVVLKVQNANKSGSKWAEMVKKRHNVMQVVLKAPKHGIQWEYLGVVVDKIYYDYENDEDKINELFQQTQTKN